MDEQYSICYFGLIPRRSCTVGPSMIQAPAFLTRSKQAQSSAASHRTVRYLLSIR